MNELDQYIKRELKCKAYIRYVDDFLLFGNDKKILHELRYKVIRKLSTLRLKLHEGAAQIYPTNTGVPFLGFRIFPEYRRLKSRRSLAFRRKLRSMVISTRNDQTLFPKLEASVQGWVNHVRYGDTWKLRKSILGEIRL